jgi:hypothetical protein
MHGDQRCIKLFFALEVCSCVGHLSRPGYSIERTMGHGCEASLDCGQEAMDLD